MPYALCNTQLFDGERLVDGYAVIIEGQKIQQLIPEVDLKQGIKQVDLQGQLLCPGFIDLQLNGCGGVMLNGDFSINNLNTMHQTNLASGTTSFLPTLITTSDNEMQQALAVMQQYQHQCGNASLGLHLEGPFLSHAKKGIHAEHFIRKLNEQTLNLLIDHHHLITKITVAPEAVSPAQVRALSQAGIIVSLGHSNATYQQACACIDAGASFSTHLFNAMSSISGREPGVLGAIFDKKIYAGIIADGHHVASANIRISQQILQDKLCLVTDATAAAGANINSFDFVGRQIQVKDGICFGDDGTLGGSALTMNNAIKHCVETVGISLTTSLKMASLYPATALGVDQRLGKIQAHYFANLCVLDKDFKVSMTIDEGTIHHF